MDDEPTYIDYPEYAERPKTYSIIKRCNELGLNTFHRDGSPLSIDTLKNKCLVRLIKGTRKRHQDVVFRRIKDRKSPNESTLRLEVGTIMTGNDGEKWIVKNRKSGKYWARFTGPIDQLYQQGGGYGTNIPFIDNPDLKRYLDSIGEALSPYTLVPIGILMSIYGENLIHTSNFLMLGLKAFNVNTLVPFALVMSKKYLEMVLNTVTSQ